MKNTMYFFPCFLFIAAIFLLLPSSSFAQRNPLSGAGNSYVNISKRSTGGVVQKDDTLEIRTTYFFSGSYNSSNSSTLYRARYYDSVPLKTAMLITSSDSLRLITNEGITSRRYGLSGVDGDAAVYSAITTPGNYQIRINVGGSVGDPGINFGNLTSTTGAGNVQIGSFFPKLFGGVLITTSFRVKVTGNAGDTIVLAAAKFIYRKTNNGADTVITASPYKIYISDNNASGLCSNALGGNLASEFGGTFGSGNTQNRTTGPTFAIPNYDYRKLRRDSTIGDGNYSFVNNLSPTANTNFNARMKNNCTGNPIPVNDSCDHRMHGGFWDIIGDHTGTINNVGNLATPKGSTGGYMLVVNSDVVTSEAYRQTVTGLCPDTYYEFSAWVKNICKRCGIDSASTSTYKTGVYPNLTFSMNGLDRYSTGQMDTVGWVKKGFVFRTGPNDVSATLSIRNNASGGGGNDWAIDDIAIGTCGPAMTFNYKPVFLGCSNGSVADLEDTVSYTYNPKYAWYKWEISTDNGFSWHTPPVPKSDSAVIGPAVNGVYKFVTKYPQFVAYGADSGNLYRVVVATSQANLSSTSCSFTNGESIMLKIVSCPMVLDGNVLKFTGRLNENNQTTLNWIVYTEANITRYDIEKSIDGVNFIKVGDYNATKNDRIAEYQYEDQKKVNGTVYFRLKVFSKDGLYTYSKVIAISKTFSFMVNALLNPFSTSISADIIMPEDGMVTMNLHDNYGRLTGRQYKKLFKGLNKVTYDGLNNLSRGMYYITFEHNKAVIQRKITKLN